MKQNEETIPEYEKADWGEYEKAQSESGQYFKAELDKNYNLVFKKAMLVRDKKYLDNNGKPRLKIILSLASINGAPSEKVFETGSFSIMREIKKTVDDGSLERSTFLLKKRAKGGDKIEYIFEKIGEVAGKPASSKEVPFA